LSKDKHASSFAVHAAIGCSGDVSRNHCVLFEHGAEPAVPLERICVVHVLALPCTNAHV
jgi:hypothetical protein